MFLLVYSTMDEINISRHFIERFNQRYMKSDVKWDILDLKMYLTKIFTPSQLRHLMRRKHFSKDQYIWMGKDYYVIVKNNNMVTIKYKDFGKYLKYEK
mgnify:FL=1